jgi:hypothetical protein
MGGGFIGRATVGVSWARESKHPTFEIRCAACDEAAGSSL